ncbi:MAG TPA: DNA translocase FtsK 4TM domain-containing protein [Nitrospiraceae bacterium]|nr:DNA translocase FtsK 4TM domain-containing protein [Nitrospiraceae bacterium]
MIGVILITLGLLVLLSLLSYAPTDVGLFTAPPAAGHQTRNMIGMAGASLAAGLFWIIGAASYFLPVLFAAVGARSFARRELNVTMRTAAASLGALVFLSGLLDLEMIGVPTMSSGFIQKGMAGGLTGQALADTLSGFFASTGAHILVVSGLLITLLFAAPISLIDWWQRVEQGWVSLAEAVAAMLPERRPRPDRSKKAKVKPLKINRAARRSDGEDIEEDFLPPHPDLLPSLAAGETLPNEAVRPAPLNESERNESIAIAAPTSSGYTLPDPRDLLSDLPSPVERMTDEALKVQAEVLARALLSFGIEGKVTEIHPGPVVTMYEFEPAPGVKVARIVNLSDDLALALKATSLRIVAPLPGKSVVGVEVPNRHRETVSLKDVLTSDPYVHSRSKLTLALGKDIFGTPVVADLKTMPHLLVAGATGAGKSVGLNTMLLSILFKAKPDEVKLLLIDPKMLELQAYDGAPHLLRPVITDAKSANRGLGWVVQEMERRYKLLAEAGVRNIDAYNRRIADAHGVGSPSRFAGGPEQTELPMEFLSEEDRLSAGESMVPEGTASSVKPTPPAPLPYIVVMIDELADLMMVAPKEVEDKIARLAQMARASGIHLVLATQRPSVDVLTGLIKANFPARISFQVSSKTDSRTILDANGAEALLGRGDMLYLASGTGRLTRLHGSFVPDDDVRRVVEVIKKHASPQYSEELQSLPQEEAAEEQARDEVYEQAKDLVLSTGQASASLIQRRLRVGYPRAARMIERMEEEGIVSAAGRDGRREVLGRRGPVGEAEDQ